MRHGVSLLVSLEGMSRPAFQVASELAGNSRAGLTVRFLSKKLEMPMEEIEYLLDVNPRLMFTDLTKVKLVPEGYSAIKRIQEGLENRGDVPSLFQGVRALNPHEFRRFEEQIGLEQPTSKKAAAESLVEQYYRNPDAVVTYVATRGFSQTAREIFDLLWQSKDGVMPVSKVRVAHGGPEFDVEQALYDLFRGFALFEMFRFDAEDRLVRVAGLLSELRQWRESSTRRTEKGATLKPAKKPPERARNQQLSFSDGLCQIVAAIAARPARLRSDGDLFREDWRRLGEVVPEDAEPTLKTCLWVAQGISWLAQVDSELRVGKLQAILDLDRIERHRVVFDWFMNQANESTSRKVLASLLDEMKPDGWYSVIEFVRFAMDTLGEEEQPTLKQRGGHWQYSSPAAAGQWESHLVRSLEEAFFWLGIIERGERNGDTLFRVTPIGRVLLNNDDPAPLRETYPRRKCEFVVQPNFDIVVPSEDMDPLLSVPLDQFALRVSSGSATVYTVSKESFTQGIQEGHDGDAFVHFLVRYNRADELPVNVRHTLEDWRGAMKRVTLRTLHVLESDDPLVIAELMHRRRFVKYLHPVDPQQSLSYRGISKSELAKALEKEGFIVE
jgi:hypothetical protein